MWDFRAYLTRPHDGDSFWVMADTMFGGRHEPELRLLDVSTPELNEPGGAECTAFVNDWLAAVAAASPRRRWPLYCLTVQTKVYEPTQKMTFVRYLATVWPFDAQDGPSLNDDLRTFLAGYPDWGTGR
ncbi:MAG TPA: hypothetical protein VFC19_41005 [Candidatus Limnocylindrales bacterium]|nr:hypothetical protein [Candidatus Limnocylindrales bacterium]